MRFNFGLLASASLSSGLFGPWPLWAPDPGFSPRLKLIFPARGRTPAKWCAKVTKIIHAKCSKGCFSTQKPCGRPQGLKRCAKSIIYTLKWAKALFASAIRCVSSFFLYAPPSPLLAATISPASFSAMLRPFLSRL